MLEKGIEEIGKESFDLTVVIFESFESVEIGEERKDA